ncbi:MAG: hypothetical protein PVG33_03250, partial [Chloroflexota bacterium]
MSELTTRKAGRNLIRTMAIVLVIVLVYAIAVTRTDISLVKPLDPERQGNFMRVLRLLADPDLITRDDTTGNLVLSETTKLTYFAIIETIFMALMASTIGTILAIPISFLAARNLMTPITAPLAALMSALLAAGAGGAAGFLIARWLSMLAETATGNLLVGLVVFVAAAVAIWLVMKLGRSLIQQREVNGSAGYIATLRLLLALMLLTFAIAVLAQISVEAGLWLKQNLGPFGFLGNFIY